MPSKCPNQSLLHLSYTLTKLVIATLIKKVLLQAAVSHQLRILRTMGLVKYRREGRNVYYSLKDSHVTNIYREVADHIDETEV